MTEENVKKKQKSEKRVNECGLPAMRGGDVNDDDASDMTPRGRSASCEQHGLTLFSPLCQQKVPPMPKCKGVRAY